MTNPHGQDDRIQDRPCRRPDITPLPDEKQPEPTARPRPFHPLWYIPIIVVAVVASTFASVFVREATRAYGLVPAVLVGGIVVLLLVGGFHGVRWLVRALRAERASAGLLLVEAAFGLLVGLMFFFGGIGRDQWLSGPDAWFGVLPLGYLGWPTALLNGLGVGVGVGFFVHGVTRPTGRVGRAALVGSLLVGVAATVACAVGGPMLSHTHYRHLEQVAWDRLNGRSHSIIAPRYVWQADYFRPIPEACQRPEAWGKVLLAQALLDKPAGDVEMLGWIVREANHHADRPGVAEPRAMAFQRLERRAQTLRGAEDMGKFLSTLFIYGYHEDPDLRQLTTPLIDQLIAWCEQGQHRIALAKVASDLSSLRQRNDPAIQRFLEAYTQRELGRKKS